MNNPLCFVLMPFGKKPDATGVIIDFDAVYKELISPAVKEAGLESIRADEEMAGGIIQKPMFERLILCPFAVADLTTANANIFYELGVRHAARPWNTVAVFYSGGARLPFDIADLRPLPYKLTSTGTPADIANDKAALVERLIAAREAAEGKPSSDSPILQLLDGSPNITSDKTDVFREQIRYSPEIKSRLEEARGKGVDAVRAIEKELGNIKDQESGVVIDLFLSYRSVKAWNDMIALVDKMSHSLAATVLVQEQLALALNRAGHGEKAEKILTDLISRRGPSSEIYGILGRVYKDRWEAALKGGDKFLARRFLDKAIEAYLRGFEADWRDALPGMNAVP
ncbi:MAG: TRAFs-binding domain-containing protein [Chitinophagales bacterium]